MAYDTIATIFCPHVRFLALLASKEIFEISCFPNLVRHASYHLLRHMPFYIAIRNSLSQILSNYLLVTFCHVALKLTSTLKPLPIIQNGQLSFVELHCDSTA